MEATLDTKEVRQWKRYDEVEDQTGVEWLGTHSQLIGEATRVKYLNRRRQARCIARVQSTTKSNNDNGEFAWVRIADVTASERYLERTTQRLSALGQSKSVPLEPCTADCSSD